MSIEGPLLSPNVAHDEAQPILVNNARSHTLVAVEPVQHDPEYFFDDGSTYVLVQRVLFRVHRSILSRDSSEFATMFTLPLPQGDIAEGSLEENPITLQGDTPNQFRGLLWALYAMYAFSIMQLTMQFTHPHRPHEIEQAGIMKPDWSEFNRFCDLVQITHKYGFRHLENWALQKVMKWAGPVSSLLPLHPCAMPMSPCSDCSSDNCKLDLDCLYHVWELAVLCNNHSLRGIVATRLLERLRRPHADLPWLIATGEHFGDHTIVGNAYYTLMIQGREKWLSLMRAGRLSHQQLDKLHSGFYSLADKWQTCIAPSFTSEVHVCGSSDCKEQLEDRWEEVRAITTKTPADVIGKLEIALSKLDPKFSNVTRAHHDCKKTLVAKVQTHIDNVKVELTSLFVEFS